jgi:hypothetical protein
MTCSRGTQRGQATPAVQRCEQWLSVVVTARQQQLPGSTCSDDAQGQHMWLCQAAELRQYSHAVPCAMVLMTCGVEHSSTRPHLSAREGHSTAHPDIEAAAAA